MRNMVGASPIQHCMLGCGAAEADRVEHYLLCPVAWEVLPLRPPCGVGINAKMRCLQCMMLASSDAEDKQIVAAAVACYAIFRTVQARRYGSQGNAKVAIKLFIAEGMRSRRAMTILQA
eukprot:7057489-Karenia_brevis.AAC.1